MEIETQKEPSVAESWRSMSLDALGACVRTYVPGEFLFILETSTPNLSKFDFRTRDSE